VDSSKSESKLSAEQFAAKNHVKAPSVRSRICRFGHYFGVIPERLANGRLSFPDVQVKKGGEDGA
jgi:hypothetical protein